ncbi:hypothetical protein ACF0H5_007273 [Mactra antiquata]
MKQQMVLVYLICMIYLIDITTALSCLACKDSPRSRDCQYTIRCGAHESCYTDTYVTSSGSVLNMLGCRDTRQCKSQVNMVPVGKRSTDDILVCSDCCHGNLCNSELCNAEKGYLSVPLTSRGPICYSCDQQLDVDSCHVIKECGIQEECMLKRIVTQVGHDIVYTTDCVHITECNEELHKYKSQNSTSNNLIGKRSNNNCLLKCCRGDLCNENCNGNRVIFPSSTAVSSTPSTTRQAVDVSATSTTVSSTIQVTSATTSPTLTTTKATTTSASTMPGPDPAFCQSNVDCGLTFEHCRAIDSDGNIYDYINKCQMFKVICAFPDFRPLGCEF